MTFTNDSGQEPSPAAPADWGTPTPAQIAAMPRLKMVNPLVARVGREGIDIERCQAPTKWDGHMRLRCDRPATCVVVENAARQDGAIGGMALCAECYTIIRDSHGPAYAKMTPLTP